MRQLTRRRAILGAVGTGAVALAGCVSGDGDGPENNSTDQNGDRASPAADLEASITRVDSNCAGMGPGETTVFLDGQTYVVQGTIPSPDPCHEPVLDAHSFEAGTLSLTVDVEPTDDGPCADCAGEVVYEATASGVDPEQVETVSVTHSGGKTHDTSAAEIPEGPPELIEAKITETDARTRGGEEDGSAEISEFDDSGETGTLTITGTIPTEHPHHEAVLKTASVQAGTLNVAVGVKSTLGDDRMGTMPLGVVEYTAVAEIASPDGIDSVQISHPNASYGVGWASDSGSASSGRGGGASDGGSDDSQ
ncbi:hypothetical protein GRX03_03140 [Halovenus sp. WSH3]|uniref:Lipoprotein n=1 Tax=Halovenus carboxidivorans TaxID=2692199 RepID=A0A6B0SYX4_9EURY|nr:hypothetical protein [Halovenus carboxidivorans]MXR50605.1 hypothetical protein [Halovenus carboxidivorans]